MDMNQQDHIGIGMIHSDHIGMVVSVESYWSGQLVKCVCLPNWYAFGSQTERYNYSPADLGTMQNSL